MLSSLPFANYQQSGYLFEYLHVADGADQFFVTAPGRERTLVTPTLELNTVQVRYPSSASIHELFERRVDLAPSAVALTVGSGAAYQSVVLGNAAPELREWVIRKKPSSAWNGT